MVKEKKGGVYFFRVEYIKGTLLKVSFIQP